MKQDEIIEKGFQDLYDYNPYDMEFCEHEPLDIGDEESTYMICVKCEKKLKEWYE